MTSSDENEKLILDVDRAKELAIEYKFDGAETPPTDPFPEIPSSLLSAEHIRLYVEKTGLISPFYVSGGKESRLKKAAYEGRIGKCAYFYNKFGELEPCLKDTADRLIVPANSIIFVESDLEFRLPEFIALRFNLQIQHVHRGLLLGTGPLVDPGYWGKLCVPLHNLTDQDYPIPRTTGLIWLEFTKTTSGRTDSHGRIGRPPLGKEFWDIREFLERSSKQFGLTDAVPIRSSIPTTFNDLTKKNEEAAANAKKAAEVSQKSASSAKNAEENAAKAKKSAEFTRDLGIGAAFAAGATLIALWLSFFIEIGNRYSSLSKTVATLESDVADYNSNIEVALQKNPEGRILLLGHVQDAEVVDREFAAQIEALVKEVLELRQKVEEVEKENSALKMKLESTTQSTP